jgi:PRC-barrel domain
VDHPLPWLRYVDAGDLDDETIEFDGLKVRNAQMETLGHVDGFIVDSSTARPYYVVVDSGGWFKSKHYLLPVGHAQMDGDNDALVVNLSKDRIERFPGFDKDKFEKMNEDELRRFNDDTCNATSATVVTYSAAEPFESQWSRPQYATPSWWRAEWAQQRSNSAFAADADYPPSKVAPAVGSSARTYQAQQSAGQMKNAGDQDFAARQNDPSPFFDGRAQPGDVIGLDTGGERTYVGDTAEDENKRRRAAEEAVKKNRG